MQVFKATVVPQVLKESKPQTAELTSLHCPPTVQSNNIVQIQISKLLEPAQTNKMLFSCLDAKN